MSAVSWFLQVQAFNVWLFASYGWRTHQYPGCSPFENVQNISLRCVFLSHAIKFTITPGGTSAVTLRDLTLSCLPVPDKPKLNTTTHLFRPPEKCVYCFGGKIWRHCLCHRVYRIKSHYKQESNSTIQRCKTMKLHIKCGAELRKAKKKTCS